MQCLYYCRRGNAAYHNVWKSYPLVEDDSRAQSYVR